MCNLPIFDDIVTGRPSEVFAALVRKLSAYTRRDRTRRFKIGITNNPHSTFSGRYASNYDEMIVLYKTRSIDSVSRLESYLVEHNWEVADNRIGGGGGRIGEPPYYLYIVRRF
jgi:hypothetical protein